MQLRLGNFGNFNYFLDNIVQRMFITIHAFVPASKLHVRCTDNVPITYEVEEQHPLSYWSIWLFNNKLAPLSFYVRAGTINWNSYAVNWPHGMQDMQDNTCWCVNKISSVLSTQKMFIRSQKWISSLNWISYPGA